MPKTLVVAEMACAHEGDNELAIQLARAMARSGADICQIQDFHADELVNPRLQAAYASASRLSLEFPLWKEVAAIVRGGGAQLWSTVFSPAGVGRALELGAAGLKIHSTDVANMELITEVSHAGLPVHVGVGGSTLDEVGRIVTVLRSFGTPRVVLMHGFQAYPTPVEEAQLRRLSMLRQIFGCAVGYMDHTAGELPEGVSLSLMAISLGAEVLEKHITLDRAKLGVDHESALNPTEFCSFVASVRNAEGALGDAYYCPLSEQELAYRNRVKKRIVAARALEAGSLICRDDIRLVRSTEGGLGIESLGQVLASRTARDIAALADITADSIRLSPE